MAKLTGEEAALLRGIVRAKADDLPRLIYADWLEEQNRGARAELIRIQVAEAHEPRPQRRPSHDWDIRHQRADDLLARHSAEWFRAFPKWVFSAYTDGNRPSFTRGFPSEWSLVAAPFFRYGPQLLDRTPGETVSLAQVKNIVPELVRCVWLREVGTVELRSNDLTDRDIEALVESEWLVGVKVLHLCDNSLTDVGVRSLAHCRFLRNLNMLCLRDNRLTIAGVEALADSPVFSSNLRIAVEPSRHLYGREYEVNRLLGTRHVEF